MNSFEFKSISYSIQSIKIYMNIAYVIYILNILIKWYRMVQYSDKSAVVLIQSLIVAAQKLWSGSTARATGDSRAALQREPR